MGVEAGKTAKTTAGPIKTFEDLIVYQNTYKASLDVIKNIIPDLPAEERYDLADHLRRSSKAVPRLIAEGYSKRHQKRGFQKYLDDALAESNEMIVCLHHARDLYGERINAALADNLISVYTVSSKQIATLAQKWQAF